MARIKYYYDTESCRYERIKVSTTDIILNFLGFIVLLLIAGAGIAAIYIYNFDSPKEAMLKKENKELRAHINVHSKQFESLEKMVNILQERDDNVYRSVLGAEPIPQAMRQGGIGGVNRYSEYMEGNLSNPELVTTNYEKIEQLKTKMNTQNESYDRLLELAKKKEERFAALPAIQPVSNKKLKRLSSGFGMRNDPINQTRRMHYGIDFSAPKGTPIYATANGVVSTAKFSPGGFGYYVKIDHGYGYETLYGHMRKYIVKRGQNVKRGEIIGYVGNSGKSTAPHLHYEVHKNKEKINPVYFFSSELSTEEFEEILRLASMETSALGSW
ncbi:MAG: M23 family metallopeptidase [Bacteroidota bacterium]